jgi:hypothetical protein
MEPQVLQEQLACKVLLVSETRALQASTELVVLLEQQEFKEK